MSQLNFSSLNADFGARVTGIDLTRPLSDEEISQIRDAIDTYQVLCFPGQDMTDAAQLAFTRQLGEPEAEHVTFGKTGEVEYFGTVGNVGEDGVVKGNAHVNTKYQSGNQLWHSDSSFREVPSYVSILHGYEVPEDEGNTEFASMRGAYENLPEDMKALIDPLYVLHDYVFSRSQVAPVDPSHAASLPPVKHRLVKENPGNGKKNLFVGSHARSIPGWSGVDSRKLIDDLNKRAVEPENVYSHPWQAGDTVVWDNRCVLHRGTGYDADKWRRRLRQTRVVGDEKGEVPAP